MTVGGGTEACVQCAEVREMIKDTVHDPHTHMQCTPIYGSPLLACVLLHTLCNDLPPPPPNIQLQRQLEVKKQ